MYDTPKPTQAQTKHVTHTRRRQWNTCRLQHWWVLILKAVVYWIVINAATVHVSYYRSWQSGSVSQDDQIEQETEWSLQNLQEGLIILNFVLNFVFKFAPTLRHQSHVITERKMKMSQNLKFFKRYQILFKSVFYQILIFLHFRQQDISFL